MTVSFHLDSQEWRLPEFGTIQYGSDKHIIGRQVTAIVRINDAGLDKKKYFPLKKKNPPEKSIACKHTLI